MIKININKILLIGVLQLMSKIPNENKSCYEFDSWLNYAKDVLNICNKNLKCDIILKIYKQIENIVKNENISKLKKINLIYGVLTDLCIFITKLQ